jgi:hypothetical protein
MTALLITIEIIIKTNLGHLRDRTMKVRECAAQTIPSPQRCRIRRWQVAQRFGRHLVVRVLGDLTGATHKLEIGSPGCRGSVRLSDYQRY